MPLRVMHVVNSLEKGGLENGLVNLISHMRDADVEHVVCTIRGLGPNADRLPKDRVEIVPLARQGAGRVQTPALVRAIRRARPDVVHSRNWAAIEAVGAARLAGGCAVVHSEHGLEAAAAAGEPWRRVLCRRIAYELADSVFSVSRQLRDLHAARTGYPAERIQVIHNGVDPSRFSPDAAVRSQVRQELGIRADAFCIGCVANLLPVKDHATLLKALRTAALPADWQLLLIGEGAERAPLEAYTAAQGWQQRVRFLGSSSRVPELLNAMDVFALPSVAEGINNSLLEAMSTNLAVTASAVGGNTEIVVDGDSGLLFAAGDAATLGGHLSQLSASPELRRELGARARQRVREHFSMDTMVSAYLRLYSSLRSVRRVPALTSN